MAVAGPVPVMDAPGTATQPMAQAAAVLISNLLAGAAVETDSCQEMEQNPWGKEKITSICFKMR